jgi:hypothetical protein
MRHHGWFAAAGACVVASAVHADTVTIFDGTFNDSDWALSVNQYGTGGGSGAASQVLSGGFGDNGAARMTANTANPTYSGAYNASLYTALNISFDARYIDGLSAIGAVVRQNGVDWFWGYEINTPDWQHWSFTPTDTGWVRFENSAGVGGPGPDFSANGGALTFGFYSANGTAGGWYYTNTGLYDNFTVTFVPAPGAVLGLAMLPMIRRRRR